jgi:homoserine dehydrogenase
MSNSKLKIGLFGFGVVGEGLYKVLQQTSSLNATIAKVCIKHSEKKRNAPAELFTTNAEEILNDESINVIVELIDDAVAAHYIVTTSLKKGKSVVSANKKLIAENLQELLSLQKQFDVPFLYEAAACASIPVIRNLEEYYDNDLLQSVCGIVNGSTNFILTKIFDEKLEFLDALLLAQQLGFAESDPSLDILGIDAVNKLTILLVHAYGIVQDPKNILHNGIQQIHISDARYAAEKDYQVKLIARATKLKNGKIAAFVLPHFIGNDSQLFHVANEYNGVVIESGFADKQFFYGKGAGSFPTASAVLSDISALRYDYKYEYKKKYHQAPSELTTDFHLQVYISFTENNSIPKDQFEWIEEWHSGQDRSYLSGVIHFEKLLTTDWWKQDGISLILTPDPIIENVELRSLKKKSLELAGVGL